MSNSIFVVSEWLPEEGHEKELWSYFKGLIATILKNEKGCIRANVTRQVFHPDLPAEKSKYSIVILQEYVDMAAFDFHCKTDYIVNVF